MMEYSIQTGLSFVQTACAVVGIGGAGLLAKNALLPKGRSVEPLYRRLHGEGGPHLWMHQRVPFRVSPYAALSRRKAVILQGRTQEGKTTLLRTSVPWYSRWNVFGMKWLCWHGIYLNGVESSRNESFERWVTSQMFGITTASGSEVKRSLWEWRQSHWFRLKMEILRMPSFLLPRPVYIVVDQFEELLKRFPEQALPWADAITNYHTRNNLARVIFVVNSEPGAHSLLNMDGLRSRFTTVVLTPSTVDQLHGITAIDPEVYVECRCNIGLHHLVLEALSDGAIARESVPALAESTLARWELDYQVPFAQQYHHSWFDVGLPEAKRRLLEGLEPLLHVPEAPHHEDDHEIQAMMRVVTSAVKRLDARQFYQFTQSQWHVALSNRHLATPGLSEMDATVVAKHIKRVMGSPLVTDTR